MTNAPDDNPILRGFEIAWNYWRSGGWLMIPLCLLCLLIFFRYLAMRKRLVFALSTPPGFPGALRNRIEGGSDLRSVQRWLLEVPGSLSRMALHLLDHTGRGLSFRESYRFLKSAELSGYTHAFRMIEAFVMAAPLLGLLGTVIGMIETFDGVAQPSGDKVQRVADGIGQALVSTQTGLAVALPGTAGVAHLKRLHKRLEATLSGEEGPLGEAIRDFRITRREDDADRPQVAR